MVSKFPKQFISYTFICTDFFILNSSSIKIYKAQYFTIIFKTYISNSFARFRKSIVYDIIVSVNFNIELCFQIRNNTVIVV